MTDKPADDQSPPPAGGSSDTGGIISLISSWMSAQKAITGAGSKLLLADSKFAAATALQIIILAVLASIFIVTAWVLICVLATVALMNLGLSMVTAIAFLLVIHLVLLGLIMWAIVASLPGLRFETSRALLRKVKTEIAPPDE